MTTMQEALSWVKDALTSKAVSPELTHYLVRDGRIYATDGRMTASHLFPSKETFCVSGAEFEAVIARANNNTSIELGDGCIVVHSGRLRGTIKTIDPKDWFCPVVGESRIVIPSRLLPALKQLRPFISDNASRPWALCVRAAVDTLYATNNVSAVAVPEIDLDGVNVLIPYWAVDFVLSRDGVTHWEHGDGYVAFHWASGAWMRTQLMNDEYPPQVEEIIGKGGVANHAIRPEWKAAFEEACGLIEDVLVLHPDKMTGINKNLNVEIAAETLAPTLGYSAWVPKFLAPVIACATHWQPDTYPGPTPFRGDGIIGVIVGRRI